MGAPGVVRPGGAHPSRLRAGHRGQRLPGRNRGLARGPRRGRHPAAKRGKCGLRPRREPGGPPRPGAIPVPAQQRRPGRARLAGADAGRPGRGRRVWRGGAPLGQPGRDPPGGGRGDRLRRPDHGPRIRGQPGPAVVPLPPLRVLRVGRVPVPAEVMLFGSGRLRSDVRKGLLRGCRPLPAHGRRGPTHGVRAPVGGAPRPWSVQPELRGEPAPG